MRTLFLFTVLVALLHCRGEQANSVSTPPAFWGVSTPMESKRYKYPHVNWSIAQTHHFAANRPTTSLRNLSRNCWGSSIAMDDKYDMIQGVGQESGKQRGKLC